MLLTWTSAGGCELRAAAPGPRGLTPLHLAAVLDDGGKLAALLTGALERSFKYPEKNRL